ncbi:pachytene checkpoint protein 2 homolog isoform X1 [Bacillus rossius redtenbacheri]|uniref:pachytene checkpoint protein 2 homolog isoform X1 n=1 Tax=Bacillus rossius redtenbacheri TaxID=93214 RepID=UPI002FDCDC01
MNIKVDVEVTLKPSSDFVYRKGGNDVLTHHEKLKNEIIENLVRDVLKQKKTVAGGEVIRKLPDELSGVEKIRICELSRGDYGEMESEFEVDTMGIHFNLYEFVLTEDESLFEHSTSTGNGKDVVTAAKIWHLPSVQFEGIWETLIMEPGIKTKLLSYVETMLWLSDAGVNSKIIACNRLVLLHGPPGTGKTSLCKALSHKLAIRLRDRYSSGMFVEINAHNLFSKFFSESGKSVTQVFTALEEKISAYSDTFFCILMDEVESFTHVRQSNSGDPSDAIRIVNAILNQIDSIKRYSNVILLATSNLTDSIDPAFLDRADISQYIGLPPQQGIYQIYLSTLKELERTNLISKMGDECPSTVALLSSLENRVSSCIYSTERLLEISRHSAGLSGRTLRKIPLVAFSMLRSRKNVKLGEFLNAMKIAVTAHHKSTKK